MEIHRENNRNVKSRGALGVRPRCSGLSVGLTLPCLATTLVCGWVALRRWFCLISTLVANGAGLAIPIEPAFVSTVYFGISTIALRSDCWGLASCMITLLVSLGCRTLTINRVFVLTTTQV